MKKDDVVSFPDENGRTVRGRLLSYGQANDGTGRHGWWVRTLDGRRVYWRPEGLLRAVRGYAPAE